MTDFDIPYLKPENTASQLMDNIEPFLRLWRHWKCKADHFNNKSPLVLPEAFYLRTEKGEKTISLFEIDDAIKCEVSMEAVLFLQFLTREKRFRLKEHSVPVCLIRSFLIDNLTSAYHIEGSITIAKTPLNENSIIAHHWDIISENMHLFYSLLAKSSKVIYQEENLPYKKLITV